MYCVPIVKLVCLDSLTQQQAITRATAGAFQRSEEGVCNWSVRSVMDVTGRMLIS